MRRNSGSAIPAALPCRAQAHLREEPRRRAGGERGIQPEPRAGLGILVEWIFRIKGVQIFDELRVRDSLYEVAVVAV